MAFSWSISQTEFKRVHWKKKVHVTTWTTEEEWLVTENIGFVLWEDRKMVMFLCSDLRGSSTIDIQSGGMQEAIFC